MAVDGDHIAPNVISQTHVQTETGPEPERLATKVTLAKLLEHNLKLGTPTRPGFESPSVATQQRFEFRQATPPLPSEPQSAAYAPPNDPADFDARCKHLRARLFDVSKTDIFYTLTRTNDDTQPKTAVLNICALQSLAVYQLQYDISCCTCTGLPSTVWSSKVSFRS